MRLLLTSAGFTNKSIVNCLKDLSSEPHENLNLLFIPTAANVEIGDKNWLINDLVNCQKIGFKSIDILDFSSVERKIWQPRFESADILFFGGGNLHYLMECVKKAGLDKLLPKWLDNKIYVGLSAGSMLVGKWWSCKIDSQLYDEPAGPDRYYCLGLVDFFIIPHLNSNEFPKVRIENLKKTLAEIDKPIYAFDDNSAVVVNNAKIKVVSEGIWEKIN